MNDLATIVVWGFICWFACYMVAGWAVWWITRPGRRPRSKK